MKILAACDGNTLNSRIVKRFERAAWYLIAESSSKDYHAIRNQTHQDHHSIVDKAARENVEAIVAGRFLFGSAHLMSTYNLHVAIAHNLTVREALERISRRELNLVEAAHLRHLIEEQELSRRGRNLQFLRGRKGEVRGVRTPGMSGQHHLQQYGGRGH